MNIQIEAVLFCAVFLIVFGLAAVLIIRGTRRDRERQRLVADSLGFHRLDPVPTELSDRIIAIHRRIPSERFAVRNVFQRSLPEGDYYLYDLWEAGSESDNNVERCAVAVVSAGANLPRFTVSPRLELPGKLGGLAGRMTDWLARQFGREIAVEQEGFQEHYQLVGEDEFAVRAAVTADLLDYLGRAPGLAIQAGGKLFTVTSFNLKTRLTQMDLETVQARYEHAVHIAHYLFG